MTGEAPARPTVVVDVDPPAWLIVPPADMASGPWREAAAALFAFSDEVDRTGGVTPPVLDVDGALDGLLAMAATLGETSRLAAGFSVPGAWPLPVIVDAGLTGDDAPDLLELGRARGGSPLEAPLIDELPDDVGPGVVVTRFDLDLEGRVWVTVTAAARRDGLDVTTTWRSTDLGLVPLQTPAVVELAGRVRLVDRADDLQETSR
ncbi:MULTISPECIES: hypothetical protein [unclassified Frigoribacterium]|uniref:hypothetical protein n=1 Tax=unclassified Frigoribacterium TaxID=2627005 RepID=UPI000F499EA6|nr:MULTISPECIES: hypothetical protein [unclassified Frigoribacterium]ROP75607.1 hypothetical protein EDF18_2231 [Frigoribacterium sp. PhB107]TDT64155.1 hypothetical protein EDF20_1645 [Frigoribacterium sp. PhB116]